jgi:hypothetical protein
VLVICDGVVSHKKASKAQNENKLKGDEKRVSDEVKNHFVPFVPFCGTLLSAWSRLRSSVAASAA